MANASHPQTQLWGPEVWGKPGNPSTQTTPRPPHPSSGPVMLCQPANSGFDAVKSVILCKIGPNLTTVSSLDKQELEPKAYNKLWKKNLAL